MLAGRSHFEVSEITEERGGYFGIVRSYSKSVAFRSQLIIACVHV